MTADFINMLLNCIVAIDIIFGLYLLVWLCIAIGKEEEMSKKGNSHRNAKEECADWVISFAEKSEKEIYDLKRKQCCKCFYYDKGPGNSQIAGTCDYILLEGHSRGCSPFECKEKGIFKPTNKKAKAKAWKAILRSDKK